MKKLITLFTVLVFATAVFSQTANVKGDKALLEKKLADKTIEFVMPQTTTNEEVSKSAQYYTEYFTVDFNAETKVATIKLIDGDDMARRVITRFLLSTGVRTIHFAGDDYTIMSFYSTFLE